MYTQPGSIIQDNDNGLFTIEEAGYIILSDELYSDSSVSFVFNTPIEKVCLIPKYLSDENYLFITVDNDNKLHIGAIIKGNEKLYGDVTIVSNDVNNLTVMNNGSHFTVKYNGTIIYKFESALFVSGKVRFYGEIGEAIYSCEIEEPQSVSWESNAKNGQVEIKSVKIDDYNYMKLINIESEKAEVYEQIDLSEGTYTLSFDGKGIGKGSIKSLEGSIIKEIEINSQSLERASDSFRLDKNTSILLSFETESEIIIGKEKIAEGLDATSYIENSTVDKISVREASEVSFPVRDLIDKRTGSIYILI